MQLLLDVEDAIGSKSLVVMEIFDPLAQLLVAFIDLKKKGGLLAQLEHTKGILTRIFSLASWLSLCYRVKRGF